MLVFMACTGTGHLQKGEHLYAGAKINIVKPEKKWDTKLLKTDLKNTVILPRPNKKLLWMRPKLWIYNTFDNRRKKSIGNFIANQFGEPPVYFDAKIAGRQRDLLTERAANDGFFNIKITSTERVGRHKIKILHEIRVESPREKVDKVVFPADSTLLLKTISGLRPKSLVQPGQHYHLEEMMAERQRLSDTLRNHGWYFFSPDNLHFEADTLHPKGNLNLALKVKNGAGERERQQYRIGSITVFPDFNLAKQADSSRLKKDTLRLGCVQYVFQNMPTKADVLGQQIFLRCGDFYSNDDYQNTVFRLLNLNLYKFINIKFDVSPGSDSLLDARIYLTPFRPERVDATLSGVFSPSFYYGLRAGGGYTNRNVFRGGEGLRISANGAYLRTDKSNFDFQDFVVSDLSGRLTLPRFLFMANKKRLALSSTQFSVRHQSNWFKYDLPDLGDFRLSFQRVESEAGYSWKKNRRGSLVHEANPLSLGLQYATLNDAEIRQKIVESIPSDTTGTAVSMLTFVEFKPNYTFTLDQRLLPARKLTRYFRQRFAGQASGYLRDKNLPDGYQLTSPLNLFIESDFRQFQKISGRNVLALRAAIGAGIPLRKDGNIALLDRYIIGGAASVRAFAPRSVGPGSEPRDTSTGGFSVGKYTGNMLLETSLEYRMPIGKYPELAFFADAGNIWLTSGPDATEASKFKINRFYKELAVGTGVGLRVNLGFFVLRLDVAVPLTKPFLPDGERWVADDFHFAKKAWRRENLNWNFSFGYPF